jgi:hypothetical protein
VPMGQQTPWFSSGYIFKTISKQTINHSQSATKLIDVQASTGRTFS